MLHVSTVNKSQPDIPSPQRIYSGKGKDCNPIHAAMVSHIHTPQEAAGSPLLTGEGEVKRRGC